MTKVYVLRINNKEIGNWEESWIINKKNKDLNLDKIKVFNKLRIFYIHKVQVEIMILYQGIKED